MHELLFFSFYVKTFFNSLPMAYNFVKFMGKPRGFWIFPNAIKPKGVKWFSKK